MLQVLLQKSRSLRYRSQHPVFVQRNNMTVSRLQPFSRNEKQIHSLNKAVNSILSQFVLG